jgi:hypothetical protein
LVVPQSSGCPSLYWLGRNGPEISTWLAGLSLSGCGKSAMVVWLGSKGQGSAWWLGLAMKGKAYFFEQGMDGRACWLALPTDGRAWIWM